MTMTPLNSSIVERVRNFFPDVTKQSLYSPDMKPTPHCGLFRNDTGACFGPAVSANYELHTTDDICALVEASEPVLGECGDVQLGFRDGHYVSIQPTKEHLFTVHKNDTVFPRLIVTARYGEAFTATIGLFRVVCGNLAIFQKVAGTSVRIRHTYSLRSKMEDLIEDFHSLRNGVGNLEVAIREMADRKVRLADFLDGIYGTPLESATERSITMHRNRTEQIVRRLMREQVALGEPTAINEVSAWAAFNAVQGFIQHDSRRKGKPGDFDRAIMALSDAKVMQAQHLALTMSV
jgi:hypothetical protein